MPGGFFTSLRPCLFNKKPCSGKIMSQFPFVSFLSVAFICLSLILALSVLSLCLFLSFFLSLYFCFFCFALLLYNLISIFVSLSLYLSLSRLFPTTYLSIFIFLSADSTLTHKAIILYFLTLLLSFFFYFLFLFKNSVSNFSLSFIFFLPSYSSVMWSLFIHFLCCFSLKSSCLYFAQCLSWKLGLCCLTSIFLSVFIPSSFLSLSFSSFYLLLCFSFPSLWTFACLSFLLSTHFSPIPGISSNRGALDK